jgi:hypothetical protein
MRNSLYSAWNEELWVVEQDLKAASNFNILINGFVTFAAALFITIYSCMYQNHTIV